MNRTRQISVLLAATLFGLTTFAAQTLLLRRFLWRAEATEVGVALFFSCWLLWSGIGAAVAATARGQRAVTRLAHYEWLPTLLALLLYFLCYALIGNLRAWLGIPVYQTLTILTLAWGCLLATAPFCLLVGWGMPLLSHAFKLTALPVSRAFACEALGAALCGTLLTALFIGGCTPDPRDSSEWRRTFPTSTTKPQRFETGGGTTLMGLHGNTFYALTAGGGYELLPEGDQSMRRAALALSQRPYATNILLLGEVPLSTAAALKQFRPDLSITYAPSDPLYGTRLVEALGTTPLRLEVQAAGTTPHHYLAALPPQSYELVMVMPPAATTLGGCAWRTVDFMRQLRRITKRSGALLYALAISGDALTPEKSVLLSHTVAALRAVWPEGGTLAAGDGGWWVAAQVTTLIYDASTASQRLSMLKKESLFPSAAILHLYDPTRAHTLAQQVPALDTTGTPTPPLSPTLEELLAAGVGESLRRDYPTTTPGRWIAKLRTLPLLRLGALLCAALWLAPIALSSVATADKHRRAAWLAACGALGLVTSLAILYQLQIRFGALYLLAGTGSALYLGGLFVGNLLGERLKACTAHRYLLRCLLPPSVPLTQCAVALLFFSSVAHLPNAAAVVLFCLPTGCAAGLAMPLALGAQREEEAREAATLVLADGLGAAWAGVVLLLLLPLVGLTHVVLIFGALAVAIGLFSALAHPPLLRFSAALALAITLVIFGRALTAAAPTGWSPPRTTVHVPTLRGATENRLRGVPRRLDRPTIEHQLRAGTLSTNEAAFWE